MVYGYLVSMEKKASHKSVEGRLLGACISDRALVSYDPLVVEVRDPRSFSPLGGIGIFKQKRLY